MANKDNVVKISPTKVENAVSSDEQSVELPAGRVLIQPIKDGKALGEPFIATEKTANKVYSNKSKYEIKKKAPLSLAQGKQ